MISLRDGRLVPRLSVQIRDNTLNTGVVTPARAVYLCSGSIDSLAGSTTGSFQLNVPTFGFNFARIMIFHSGAAASFDLSFENKRVNSPFDPTAVVADYRSILGSTDYTKGIDQVENLVGLTDSSGSIYMRVKPHGIGNNSFKYLLFFEEVIVYIDASNNPQGQTTQI